MKLYLAGAISYNEEKAQKHFEDVKDVLECAGFEVISPFEIISKGKDYVSYLKCDVQEMLKCDGVAVIVNDELVRSFGTIKELNVATDYVMEIKSVREWVKHAQDEQEGRF